MNLGDLRSLVLKAFMHLRAFGVPLGVGELLDGLRLLELDGPLPADDSEETAAYMKQLRLRLQLLWCTSPSDTLHLEQILADIQAAMVIKETPEPVQPAEPSPTPPSRPPEQPIAPPKPPEIHVPEPPPRRARALPFMPPQMRSGESQSRTSLQTYWPVSRRFMQYAWRYLRRPLPDGPPTLLDVDLTIDHTIKQGVFTGPVYRRDEVNHAELVMYIDHRGSMMPFHPYLEDLVDTACNESTLERVEVFYFQKAPRETVFLNMGRNESVLLDDTLSQIDGETSVLVVSDAGAANNTYDQQQVDDNVAFLHKLKKRTNLIAWLNPMPVRRWADTSAEILTDFVDMFPMDQEGFRGAVDTLRGQKAWQVR